MLVLVNLDVDVNVDENDDVDVVKDGVVGRGKGVNKDSVVARMVCPTGSVSMDIVVVGD